MTPVRLFRKLIQSPSSVLGHTGLVALALGLLVLLLIAGSASWQASRNAKVLAEAARTQELRRLVNAILISAQDAETGQRGFLLTDDPAYLPPYTLAVQALPNQLDRLGQLLPHDPRVIDLREAVQGKLMELKRTIDLFHAGDRAGGALDRAVQYRPGADGAHPAGDSRAGAGPGRRARGRIGHDPARRTVVGRDRHRRAGGGRGRGGLDRGRRAQLPGQFARRPGGGGAGP
ncbi:MAG: CHASE3 domain-containing protein [Acetobacteraceae bacterium]